MGSLENPYEHNAKCQPAGFSQEKSRQSCACAHKRRHGASGSSGTRRGAPEIQGCRRARCNAARHTAPQSIRTGCWPCSIAPCRLSSTGIILSTHGKSWSVPARSVSLKVNTLGGRGISTNVQLVAAICERLQEAGVKPADIVVWDRDSDELERAGFHLAIGGDRVQCYGTDRVGYEAGPFSLWQRRQPSVEDSHSTLERAHQCSVLKDHDGAGVTIALKNMYGVIHNPNKYHPNGCNPYVADVNMLPEIRSRMRLTICDATTAMYEGGPGYKPEHSWNATMLCSSPRIRSRSTTQAGRSSSASAPKKD